MAKRIDLVAGKSIDELLQIPLRDLEKMTESQLRVIVGRGVSAGNKRLRRFQDALGGLPSTAMRGGIQNYEEMKFSTVGKDKQGLMEEYKRIKQFMRSEISSLRGYKNVQKKSIKALQYRGIDISTTNYNSFWKAYDKLKELHPEIAEANYKYGVLDEMSKLVEGKKRFSINALVKKMNAKLAEIYEEQERLKNADGTSGFFEV